MKKIWILLSLATILGACEDNDTDDDFTPDFDQSAMLSTMSDQIIVPNYQNLNSKTQELVLTADSFVLHKTQAYLDKIQASFKATHLAWQKVSFLEFGPADQVGLRSNLNVFPVDQSLIEQNITAGNVNLDALGNKAAKGFPAVDYLINNGSDSLIISQFATNARGDYLKLVIQDIANKINSVNSDWNSYQSTFKTATGSDVGSSTGMLVNALNLHYERFFRDGKIGIPLGVRSSGTSLPDHAEAYFGEFSFDLINANYEAMKELYLGKNGIGLDDYLIASNGSDVNEIIQSQMSVIEGKLAQFNSTSMPMAIQNQNSELLSTYQEIQKLIVYWKVDMPSRLGILITYQDNDGD